MIYYTAKILLQASYLRVRPHELSRHTSLQSPRYPGEVAAFSGYRARRPAELARRVAAADFQSRRYSGGCGPAGVYLARSYIDRLLPCLCLSFLTVCIVHVSVGCLALGDEYTLAHWLGNLLPSKLVWQRYSAPCNPRAQRVPYQPASTPERSNGGGEIDDAPLPPFFALALPRRPKPLPRFRVAKV
ncbi:hypothetical protein QAD02_004003 [Eretmocerus hayati]|uniref:Uncharacterized protein n=1 Tax=Eretmocerus hayati TaxID=131215 RepID=A0ACC2NNJ0_9HYME|nr:hypothetical protein QAD02_004003 [Eretmocerus hayati]